MIKVAAFDFDGTLADSVDFCLHVFDLVFAKYLGDKAPDREDIYRNFGMNEPGVIRHYFGRYVPEAEADFFRWHRELHPQLCPDMFPGCRELLAFLKEKNVTMTLLTGRSLETCQISLEYLQLKEYFSTIQTGSPERNDKSAQLRKLLNDYQLAPEELVYIGDAVSDAEACRAAGVTCLSAAWMKSARIAELEKINPQKVFTNIEDIQKFLAAHI